MQAIALADFLESRELDILCRWIQAFVKESTRSQSARSQSARSHSTLRAVSPEAIVVIFKQILGLLRDDSAAAHPIGQSEVYNEEAERRHLSDLLEILLNGESVLRKEILGDRAALSFGRAAEELEQINAAFHQILELHVTEFCGDCADSLMDYCRQVNQGAADRPPSGRKTRPLHDPLERRSLAFPPPLQPHTNLQDTLAAFLRENRQEIVARWASSLDEREERRFSERVESINGALSELLDEALASVACCTLRPPRLRNTPTPTDAAPNALHVILAGEEVIAGLLRRGHPVIDGFWLELRAGLNDAFHQLLRNNVASECTRCHTLLNASRDRLRTLQNRAT